MPVTDTLKGKEVVISGDFRHEYRLTKAEMCQLAKRAGARHAGEDPRKTTDIFVKGTSPLYKYGRYGDKEAELVLKAPNAVVIDGARFFELLRAAGVQAWPPPARPLRVNSSLISHQIERGSPGVALGPLLVPAQIPGTVRLA